MNMGVDLSGVNLDNVQANAALDPLPAGWYDAQIVESGTKQSSSGGTMLELTLQVLSGPHTGRKLFDRLNIVNANPVAQEIAFKTLKAIYNAVGVARVTNSSELHGKPMKVKVKLRPATAEYDASNEISGYDHANADRKLATAVGTAPAGGTAAAPAGTPPWGGPPGVQAAAPAPAPAPAPAAGFNPAAAAAQPWATAAAPAAAAPTPPAPPAPVAAPAATWQQNAQADGWQPHPTAPGYHWRGQDVVPDDQLATHYAPAPVAPAAPPAPPAPPAPQQAAATAAPPWAAGAAAAPAAAAPAPAAAAVGAPPPWAVQQ